MSGYGNFEKAGALPKALPAANQHTYYIVNIMKTTDSANDNHTIHLDSIGTYHDLYGVETLHPLVSVVHLTDMTLTPLHQRFLYGFYALWLKHGTQCSIRYGRNLYDYREGTIVSFAPGQMVEVERSTATAPDPETVGLLFHPDLIHGTSLGRHIGEYHFFDYDSTESLHLSKREQKMFTDTLASIRQELEMPIDRHSRAILVDRIKLLLDYCSRFYDRQFITRHRANSDVLVDFEENIREYFRGDLPRQQGLPTVAYFAEKANLSPNYFGDLIKNETGQSATTFIQQHVVSLGKQLVLDDRYSISQIADRLGFQYAQHFSRFFKRHTGLSPKEYRMA